MTNLAIGAVLAIAGFVIYVGLSVSGYTVPILVAVAVLFGLPILGMLARRVLR